MRVLVCGGRDYSDKQRLFETLDALHSTKKFTLVIHGMARGADTLADEWARSQNIKIQAFPADWKNQGKSAGYIRNTKMLVEGKPDFVVAFPGGRGTQNMVSLSYKAGLSVAEIK